MLRLTSTSLDWALQHALHFGDTDVFPLPFEYRAIEHDWQEIRQYLENQNVLEWTVRPHRTMLAPKGKFAFRAVTQLDPLDFLIYSALVKEIASDIEARRIDLNEQRVFSYRYTQDPDGRLFSRGTGYGQFLERSREILNDPTFTHVALTDISDYYPRIYHHRLEGALSASTSRGNHVRSLVRCLLAGWNGTETYGIPVGSAASRLLAEINLADVDESLLAHGIHFVRFNDDYRIFCQGYAEAFRAIALLADILYRNHGLTLQPQKTSVLQASVFRQRYLDTPFDREFDSLQERFSDFIEMLGLDDPYEPIDYDDLSPEQRELVDSMNLAEVFSEALAGNPEPDYPVIKFVLQRLAQLDNDSVVSDLLSNIDVLHPIFPDIIKYLQHLRTLSPSSRQLVGEQLLSLLRDSVVSELEYHRLWGLELFASSNDWDNEQAFVQMYAAASDNVTRRQLILSMARAGHAHWFQSQWRQLFEQPHWPRRALILGASCLPLDARRHWYRSVESRLDPLECAVMRWARQNPLA